MCCAQVKRRFWSCKTLGESKKGKGAGRGWGSEGTKGKKPATHSSSFVLQNLKLANLFELTVFKTIAFSAGAKRL